MKVKLENIYSAIEKGSTLEKEAEKLKISRSLLYLRLKEHGYKMPKKKAGRKVKIIFE